MAGLELIDAPGLRDAGLAAAFTTRTGGSSEGPYASLNLTWSRGDDKAAVAENRRRVGERLGGLRLVFANQVHGTAVLRAEDAADGEWSAGEGDALMTDRPGLALCAQTADCVPILLFDPRRPAIAAIHSGWRGTLAGIAQATLDAMAQAYGTRPADVKAAIGPSISKARYRVGPEVIGPFEGKFGSDAALMGPKDHEGGAGLDVAEACRRSLVMAGVPASAISRVPGCTFTDETRFFSSRRAARDGHPGLFGGQCGIIALKKRA